MAVETVIKQVAIGAQQNVRVLVDDLELLKSLKESDEDSLAVVFHRIIRTYHAMQQSGNFFRITKSGEADNASTN